MNIWEPQLRTPLNIDQYVGNEHQPSAMAASSHLAHCAGEVDPFAFVGLQSTKVTCVHFFKVVLLLSSLGHESSPSEMAARACPITRARGHPRCILAIFANWRSMDRAAPESLSRQGDDLD